MVYYIGTEPLKITTVPYTGRTDGSPAIERRASLKRRDDIMKIAMQELKQEMAKKTEDSKSK